MKLQNKTLLTHVARFCYIFGASCLIVSLTLSFFQSPGAAAPVAGKGNCDTGWVEKDEQAPFEYNGGEIITSVYVKSGENCFLLTVNNPSDGCYQATGLGSSTVSVTRIGTPGPTCQEISHVEYYAGQVDPTPTPTNTPPPIPPTPTPTVTPTHTPLPPTPTPTDTTTPIPPTPTPTVTPTNTLIPSTPTPTDTTTPIPPTPTPTVTPTTTPLPPTPTPTPTATDAAATITPTDPPPTNTPTQPESISSPTPVPTLAQPTSPASTPELVLIPETGVDLSFSDSNFVNDSWMVLLLGLGFFGIGLIFHGASKMRTPDELQK